MESADQLRVPSPHTVDVLERVRLYRQRRGLEPLRVGDLADLAADLAALGQDPVKYVSDLFENHQVVFLGHQIPSRRTGQFLQELVSALPERGVNHLAMEYLCCDDQELLDVVTGYGSYQSGDEEFPRAEAQELMLRWGLRYGFGFDEYAQVLANAWKQNLEHPGSLRVLGLDYDLDFDSVTDTADLRTWFPWQHLRYRGTAARHMSDLLQHEIIDKGHRALVVCRTPHALTRQRRRPHRIWDAFDTELLAGQVVGAGNHTYAAVADRAATVLIHQPLPADGTLCDYALAADGALDAAFSMVGHPPVPLGFDTNIPAVSMLRTLSGLDDGLLTDLAQGWIYLESDPERRAPTPLRGAVSQAGIKSARRLALDGSLRRADSTPADFDGAFSATAAAAELSWTQIL